MFLFSCNYEYQIYLLYSEVNSAEVLKFTSHSEIIISDDKSVSTTSDLQYNTANIKPNVRGTCPSYIELPNRHSKYLINRKVNPMYQVNDGNFTTSFLSSLIFQSPQDFQETETVDSRGAQLSLLEFLSSMEASSHADSITSSYYNHHRVHSCADLTKQSFIQCNDDKYHTLALGIPSSYQQPKGLRRVQVESMKKKFQPSTSHVYSTSSNLFRKKRKVCK